MEGLFSVLGFPDGPSHASMHSGALVHPARQTLSCPQGDASATCERAAFRHAEGYSASIRLSRLNRNYACTEATPFSVHSGSIADTSLVAATFSLRLASQ